MQSAPTYLRNFQSVIDAFGCWPGFHDSPVLRFQVDGESIRLEVEAWEMTNEVNAQGYFKLTKRHAVGFEFHDIVPTDLERFIPGNTVFELGFSSEAERRNQGFFTVVLDSAMGSDLCGEFRAMSGSVSFVRPVESETKQGKPAVASDGDKPSN